MTLSNQLTKTAEINALHAKAVADAKKAMKTIKMRPEGEA